MDGKVISVKLNHDLSPKQEIVWDQIIMSDDLIYLAPNMGGALRRISAYEFLLYREDSAAPLPPGRIKGDYWPTGLTT
jgi:hypothetical protein